MTDLPSLKTLVLQSGRALALLPHSLGTEESGFTARGIVGLWQVLSTPVSLLSSSCYLLRALEQGRDGVRGGRDIHIPMVDPC